MKIMKLSEINKEAALSSDGAGRSPQARRKLLRKTATVFPWMGFSSRPRGQIRPECFFGVGWRETSVYIC